MFLAVHDRAGARLPARTFSNKLRSGQNWRHVATERKKVRLAILGSRGIPNSYGGYETIAQELATGLAQEGFEVYVSCESKGLRMKAHGIYGGVRLVYFPIIKAIRNVSEVMIYDAFSVFWATFVADIIYMLGYSSTLTLLLPRLFGKVVIVNVDGLESSRRKFNPLLRFLYRFLEVVNVRIADYVVVDSETIGAFYRRTYGVEPVYIPNGISEIEPLDPSVLKKYDLEIGKYYLVVARLIPDNNIHAIIEGFRQSNSRKKLVIVGPLENTRYVEKLLSSKDERTVFVGGIYEARLQRTFRHNCYAYIHGHDKGGTNPSLVEALSCGNVVLAVDVPFNREVAEDSAIYFTKDPNDISKKIDYVEKISDFSKIRKRAYAIYRKKYTAEGAVDVFAGFVEQVWKKGRPG
jgi:rhamnosyltransferase